MKDFWILLLCSMIILSCIKLDNPQMIDCTKPTPKPIKILVKDESESNEIAALKEEVKQLREEALIYQEQRDEAYKTISTIHCDYN